MLRKFCTAILISTWKHDLLTRLLCCIYKNGLHKRRLPVQQHAPDWFGEIQRNEETYKDGTTVQDVDERQQPVC